MAFCVLARKAMINQLGSGFIGDGAPLAGFTAMIFACFVINYIGRLGRMDPFSFPTLFAKNYQRFAEQTPSPVLLARLTESFSVALSC